jgi:hypothetical protein
VGATDPVRVHMIRFSAVLAISALCCGGDAFAAKAPLAIFYSFDTPAPPAVFAAMQWELERILAPSGVLATWRAMDSARNRGEDFSEIVVFRFRGQCNFKGFLPGDLTDAAGNALAETDTSNGRVLSFASVNCDRVSAFITPNLRGMPPARIAEVLGHALARVSAHEIYHMLSGVKTHDDKGIFQAGHSRKDLTAAAFSFATPENNWLRGWAERQLSGERMARSSQTQSAMASDDAVSEESDGSGFAGR